VIGALGFAGREALTSLQRDWRTAAFAGVVIAAAVFVTVAVLLASAVVDRGVARLTEGPDVSVFLSLEAGPEVRDAVEQVLRAQPAVRSVTFVSSDEAARRFSGAYPDLAPLLAEGFALPASFDVSLKPDAMDPATVQPIEHAVRALPGVDQVRFDHELAQRAGALARGVRGAGLALAVLLAFAGALAVFSVIRLAYVARRDEIEILLLVGAPAVAIRGPFVVEGALQAALGACVGVAALAITIAVFGARANLALGRAVGGDVTVSLPLAMALGAIVCAALVGALAAWLAWRSASRALTS
jgi:cell division transport system permease protein